MFVSEECLYIYKRLKWFQSLYEFIMYLFSWRKGAGALMHVRGLSRKFADTANKTSNMYPTLKKFCIKKYQLSSTNYT